MRSGINSLNNLATDSPGRLSFVYGDNTKAKGLSVSAGYLYSQRNKQVSDGRGKLFPYSSCPATINGMLLTVEEA